MKPTCIVEKCCKPKRSSIGLCAMHWARYKRNSHTELTRRANGSGNINSGGYVDIRVGGRRVYEHVWVVEHALGKPLPKGAVVHHVNEDRSDNRPENLAIFPSDAYHKLIHKRMKAAETCGDPSKLYCPVCKKYDSPAKMHFTKKGHNRGHRSCLAAAQRRRYQEKKLAKST